MKYHRIRIPQDHVVHIKLLWLVGQAVTVLALHQSIAGPLLLQPELKPGALEGAGVNPLCSSFQPVIYALKEENGCPN